MRVMDSVFHKQIATVVLVCSGLLSCESAWALRCGSKLVLEGMHDFRVIEICGDPVSTRQIGLVVQPYFVRQPAGIGHLRATRYVYAGYYHQVSVTEMVFNFGPHRLMRIIRFEGGQLASIRTAGYGYLEKR